MKKIAFYDAKAYDKPSFEHYGTAHGLEFKFLETKLNEDTAELARNIAEKKRKSRARALAAARLLWKTHKKKTTSK